MSKYILFSLLVVVGICMVFADSPHPARKLGKKSGSSAKKLAHVGLSAKRTVGGPGGRKSKLSKFSSNHTGALKTAAVKAGGIMSRAAASCGTTADGACCKKTGFMNQVTYTCSVANSHCSSGKCVCNPGFVKQGKDCEYDYCGAEPNTYFNRHTGSCECNTGFERTQFGLGPCVKNGTAGTLPG